MAAVEAGADAIGLVFWPSSPRAVSVAQARDIVRRLPALVTAVGVFVNQARQDVEAAAAAVGLSAVQLHGDEAAEAFANLALPVIKAIGSRQEAAVLGEWPEATLLVDAVDPVRRGGTARVADWEYAARVARRRPLILAGGLMPENVGAAIRAVRPWAVDVSSGVELAPGIKDVDRMAAFCRAVRATEGNEP